VIRSLVFLAAILLLALPAFWLIGTTIPVPRFRAGDITDFLLFAEALAVVYGGVALGVAVYWARARASGLALRSLGILQAGVSGAGGLGLVVVVGSGIHGLITFGSFERGVGNLWGLIVIFAVLLGAFVAGGLALLWLALRMPPGGGPARGPWSGGTGAARLPTR
jgi:hypothetical protein